MMAEIHPARRRARASTRTPCRKCGFAGERSRDEGQWRSACLQAHDEGGSSNSQGEYAGEIGHGHQERYEPAVEDARRFAASPLANPPAPPRAAKKQA
jgi:hypothetical protein